MFRYGALCSLLLNGFLVFVLGKSVPSRPDDAAIGQTQTGQEVLRTAFELEEVYGGDYQAYGFNGTWRTNGFVYSDKETENIIEYELPTGKRRLVLDIASLGKFRDASLYFSSDMSFVLLGYDPTTGFRHSVYRKYVAYDIKHRTFHEIGNGKALPLAKWSPVKNAVVYILENDIYYQDFSGIDKRVVRLTNTGVRGIIYNGIPDWVYEEEVLAAGSALWFSPDGRYLAFASFNDSNVKDAMYLYYGEPGSLDDQYPREVKIKYPKAGCTNPTVSLNLVLLDKQPRLINLKAPVYIVGEDHILYTVTWRDDSHVLATWTNRVQNKAQLVLYDTEGEANLALYDEETEGWLRIKPVFHHNQYAILLKSQDGGTKAGKYLHATRFEYNKGKLTGELDLTPGPSEVHSLVAIDHSRQRLYYLATRRGGPSERHLYAVPIDGSGKPKCISCGYVTPEGNNCTYAAASFSKNKSYYVLLCTGPDPASTAIFDADQNLITVWEDNKPLRKKLAARVQPQVKNVYVRANGFFSKVRLLLPPDFDQNKKYPLLINVYAGPGSTRITEAAAIGFQSYMTTNRSVIYGWIDGRGSSYRGSKMLYSVYRRLGTAEIKDQIDVTSALLETYPWIDESRTGIWGWSYGGYATGMVLAMDNRSVFKCGISVAPVSSWIYYDSIYTERYMGLPTPEDNLRGYNETDLTRRMWGIRGKKFMLIHGSGDDNVHFQQAMALAKALERANILFEQQVYTDEAHGLYGVSAHLYHTMDRFWEQCLGLPRAH